MTKKQKILIIIFSILIVVVQIVTSTLHENATYQWEGSIPHSIVSILFFFLIICILAVIRNTPGKNRDFKTAFTIIISVIGAFVTIETIKTIIKLIK